MLPDKRVLSYYCGEVLYRLRVGQTPKTSTARDRKTSTSHNGPYQPCKEKKIKSNLSCAAGWGTNANDAVSKHSQNRPQTRLAGTDLSNLAGYGRFRLSMMDTNSGRGLVRRGLSALSSRMLLHVFPAGQGMFY
jgi:hypothetical protein